MMFKKPKFNPDKTWNIDFIEDEEVGVCISVESLLSTLKVAEQIWPKSKPAFRGMRGFICEEVVKVFNFGSDSNAEV